MALWPHGFDSATSATAWTQTHIDQYFLNTLDRGRLVVRPDPGRDDRRVRPVGPAAAIRPVLNGLVLATLFVPSIVLLVPLYLTIVDPDRPSPADRQVLGRLAAAGANAFNIMLMKRFFDNLPREVFEAAHTDGAGPFRLFWSIVLPMSRPILGVVSVFAVIGTWKDYLWPLLVLRTRSSRCPSACRRSSRRPSWTSSSPPWRSHDPPVATVPGLPVGVPARRGVGGAIKG